MRRTPAPPPFPALECPTQGAGDSLGAHFASLLTKALLAGDRIEGFGTSSGLPILKRSSRFATRRSSASVPMSVAVSITNHSPLFSATPLRAGAMISAFMARVAGRERSLRRVVRRNGHLGARPFDEDGEETGDVLGELPGVLVAEITT